MLAVLPRWRNRAASRLRSLHGADFICHHGRFKSDKSELTILRFVRFGELAVAEDDDVELIAIDLTLGIQAEIFIDLAAGFARINHFVAAETIRNIEAKIVGESRERAAALRARGLTTDGIAQVAGFLGDTIKEAKLKMATITSRPANRNV